MSIRFKYYAGNVLSFIVGAAIVGAVAFNLLYSDYKRFLERDWQYISEESAAEPININTASVRGLQKINGIGSVRAEAIVAYREEHGEFSSVDELLNIRGIGEATLEKIRDQITL